jgi:tripartite-type tricarboxylate transporter receptor subunit TctC
MHKLTRFLAGLLSCGLSLGAPSASATFPDRPIRLVVPNTAGSATDQLARTVASTMQERGGKPVVVENKPGANGIIAATYVAKAAADGYTILIGNSTTNAANPALYLKLPYDPEKDFAPITGLGRGAQVMVVGRDFPAKTVGEFIALAKTNPGKYAYGSGGASARVATEAFARMAGIKLLHVPYKGNPLALTDLLGGHIQVFFPDMATALPMIRGGEIRPLAVTSKERSAYLPDVPTLDEAGLSGYEARYWFAAYAPAGTPQNIVQALSELMQEGVRSQASASFFEIVGMEAFATTPDELREYTRKEIADWAASVRAAGIEPE